MPPFFPHPFRADTAPVPAACFLILGALAMYLLDPVQAKAILAARPSFRMPEFTFARMSWSDFVLGSVILAMGLFYGGLAQIIAGVMEWRKKNTFGMVAFTSYGFFWISLVALIVMPRFGIADASDKNAMAAYLFIWGLFSLVLFIATFKMNRALMLVFFALVVLFILLGLGDATGSALVTRIAGYEGIACGLGAIYLGAAQILNEVYGRKILPIGEF